MRSIVFLLFNLCKKIWFPDYLYIRFKLLGSSLRSLWIWRVLLVCIIERFVCRNIFINRCWCLGIRCRGWGTIFEGKYGRRIRRCLVLFFRRRFLVLILILLYYFLDYYLWRRVLGGRIVGSFFRLGREWSRFCRIVRSGSGVVWRRSIVCIRRRNCIGWGDGLGGRRCRGCCLVRKLGLWAIYYYCLSCYLCWCLFNFIIITVCWCFWCRLLGLFEIWVVRCLVCSVGIECFGFSFNFRIVVGSGWSVGVWFAGVGIRSRGLWRWIWEIFLGRILW